MSDYSSDNDCYDGRRQTCELCSTTFKNFEDFENHKKSEKHIFNVALHTFAKYRKPLSQDRNGIVTKVTTENVISTGPVHITHTSARGEYAIELTENELSTQKNGISFIFEVKTDNKVILRTCKLLHTYPKFTLIDNEVQWYKGQSMLLDSGKSHKVKVKYNNLNVIGEPRIPILFLFQTLDPEDTFSIIKEIIVRIVGNNRNEQEESVLKSRFTNRLWGSCTIIESEQMSFPPDKYKVPHNVSIPLARGLKYGKEISGPVKVKTDEIIRYLKNQEPTRENYRNYFHYILWLDEVGARVKLSRYNMEEVTVKVLENYLVELQIEGLAEKRPSLLKNDIVKLRVHEAITAYTGVIKEVQNMGIVIKGFRTDFLNEIKSTSKNFDVQFELNRFCYERMHKAVDLCSNYGKLNILFPTVEAVKPNKDIYYHLSDADIQNKNIKDNNEQKSAVINILNKSSRIAPFIVFGPPGTGKSVTIVEAMYQIIKHVPGTKILVCAPANAACDMLVLLLSNYFNEKELIRLHSETADWPSVPEKVKQYSNRSGAGGKICIQLSHEELMSYKIIVTTLMSSGRFAKRLSVTHVFIDEAAQAFEPEALIAIGDLLNDDGLLVLAGDPKQLGPMCNSSVAKSYGFGTSLLGRLMNRDLYKNENSSYFITQLKLNYRNHPDILHLPNKIFYNSTLRAAVVRKDPISKAILSIDNGKVTKSGAVEFYGVNGHESRRGKSPSYFNDRECDVVLKYLKALTNPKAQVVVSPKDVGVIVPYVRQVHNIARRLQNELTKVEVGTTETFQGREKRVIIISTVRGKTSLLLVDKKYNMGFVSNPERFNVAVTRAISKLIIVGNPQCLLYDKNWRQMLNFCKELGTYRGFYIDPRDCHLRYEVKKRLDDIKYSTSPKKKNQLK